MEGQISKLGFSKGILIKSSERKGEERKRGGRTRERRLGKIK